MKEIQREIYPALLEEFHRPEITILVGARQVGKTFLLRKLHRHALSLQLRARFFDLEQPGRRLYR
jgi:predicted AAA+ superfamily ATPase